MCKIAFSCKFSQVAVAGLQPCCQLAEKLLRGFISHSVRSQLQFLNEGMKQAGLAALLVRSNRAGTSDASRLGSRAGARCEGIVHIIVSM